MSKYSLRPYKPGKLDIKDVYKIFVSRQLYASLRAGPKDLWNLESEGHIVAIGRVAQAQDDIQNKVLQITDEFKELYGLNFSDTYTLKKSENPLRSAEEIVLVERPTEGVLPLAESESRELGRWEGIVRAVLVDRLVSPGLSINDVEGEDDTRSFQVKSVSSSNHLYGLNSPLEIHSMLKKCRTRIDASGVSSTSTKDFKINRQGLFGLEAELDAIDELLQSFHSTESNPFIAGLAMSGPTGTGKSTFVARLSELTWARTVVVDVTDLSKNPEKSLPRLFEECLKHEPCLVSIRDLDQHLAENGTKLERALRDALTIIRGRRVLLVATMENLKLPRALSVRFRRQIQLGAPHELARSQLILHTLYKNNASISAPSTADIISQKTPGYARCDLINLVEEAIMIARKAYRISDHADHSTDAGSISNGTSKPLLPVTAEHLEQARLMIAPSIATQEHASRYRKVHWSDIGGQEATKKKVEVLFEWPLKYPDLFKSLDISPGKGLLLYGPPGCSKTMTALALATEAKLNFITIKGPELLSKFVGESEQNLRNVFARARAAAPCVIFFDEIDSIASGGHANGENRSSVNLVTTLLNEMDGVDELKGVSVLAATNKPWEIDQALLRPGRFDGMVYVGLPDDQARRQILQIRLDKIEHDPIDLDLLVRETEGCSGAEIVDLFRNAALCALEEKIKDPSILVNSTHFSKALLDLRKDTSPDLVARFDAFASRGRHE